MKALYILCIRKQLFKNVELINPLELWYPYAHHYIFCNITVYAILDFKSEITNVRKTMSLNDHLWIVCSCQLSLCSFQRQEMHPGVSYGDALLLSNICSDDFFTSSQNL